MVKVYKIYVCRELRERCKNRISQEAIGEYLDRIKMGIEINAVELDEIANKKGRKTIFPEDVIDLFGFVNTSTLAADKEEKE